LVEGEDELDAKHFLMPKQYGGLAPPGLYDTKLFSLQSKEAADVEYGWHGESPRPGTSLGKALLR
jgi:hypothetical protein